MKGKIFYLVVLGVLFFMPAKNYALNIESKEVSYLPDKVIINLKRFFDGKNVLNYKFYSEENLKNIFGGGYKFSAKNSENQALVYLSDIDIKEGRGALPENNRVCFNRIIFAFNLDEIGNVSYLRIQMVSSAKVLGYENHYVYAKSIVNIFGPTFATRDWYPLEPPLDGGAVRSSNKTDYLGNLWIDYKFKKNFFEANVHVLTTGDAQVTDIVIDIQRMQK